MKKTFTNKTLRTNLADILRASLTEEFNANYPTFFVDTDENQNLLKRHPYYIPVKNSDTGRIVAKIWPQPDSIVICISKSQYNTFINAVPEFDDMWKFYGTVEGENNCGEYVFRTVAKNVRDIIDDTVDATIVILDAIAKSAKTVEEVKEEPKPEKKSPAKKTEAKKSTKKAPAKKQTAKKTTKKAKVA